MPDTQVSGETLLDYVQDGVCFVDRDNVITYWNRGAEGLTGRTREDVLGQPWTPELLGYVDENGEQTFSRCPITQSMEDRLSLEHDLYLRHQAGHLVPVISRTSPIMNARGDVMGAIAVFSDNSAGYQAQQRIRELEQMALLCPLTEVGNRRYTEMALRNAFEEYRRYGWAFGLLFLDLDYFKTVNDTYGHPVGDQVLRMVASALRETLRTCDFVGRWGGEEFVVILPNISAEALKTVAVRCHRLVGDAHYQHEGQTVKVTASMGAVLARADEKPEACLERADRLMYQSKSEGRNRITFDQ